MIYQKLPDKEHKPEVGYSISFAVEVSSRLKSDSNSFKYRCSCRLRQPGSHTLFVHLQLLVIEGQKGFRQEFRTDKPRDKGLSDVATKSLSHESNVISDLFNFWWSVVRDSGRFVVWVMNRR